MILESTYVCFCVRFGLIIIYPFEVSRQSQENMAKKQFSTTYVFSNILYQIKTKYTKTTILYIFCFFWNKSNSLKLRQKELVCSQNLCSKLQLNFHSSAFTFIMHCSTFLTKYNGFLNLIIISTFPLQLQSLLVVLYESRDASVKKYLLFSPTITKAMSVKYISFDLTCKRL